MGDHGHHHNHNNHHDHGMMDSSKMNSMMGMQSGEDDHSAHKMGPGMDHMMKMYFHGGYDEVILFDFWRISTLGGLIGSMIGCFLLGIIYEGIKFYRESWMRGSFQSSKFESQDNVNVSTADNVEDREKAPSPVSESDRGSVKFVVTNMWSMAHFVLTLLHMVQITLAYFLMLIFMTYNSWLCAATVIGSTFGYFLFGWRKTALVDVGDHCH